MSSSVRTPLCIATSTTGALSETFIRRHCNELLPGKTCVIASRSTPPENHCWDPDGPALYTEPYENKIVRGAKRVLRNTLTPGAERKRIVEFLQKHQVEVMLAEWLDLGWKYIEICQELGIRMYGRALGYDTASRLRESNWVARYQDYNKTDGIITVHTLGKTRLEEIGVKCPIWVVPCGGEVRSVLPEHVQGEVVRLLAVGRLTAKKAPRILIESFEKALAQEPNMTLDMIGGGELLEDTRGFVKERNLESKITVHGGQNSQYVLDAFMNADLYVQHSVVDPVNFDEEGLPVSILEAMGAGLAVVSTRHAGIPDAVVHGETGLLVEERDSNAMADAIITLVRDPERRKAMAEAGFKRAHQSFSWQFEKDRLTEIMRLG